MVRSHTIETGDLRKKNAYLTEHIQKMDSTAMSAVPSSSGFSSEFSGVDDMTVDNFWESPSFMDDFSMDTSVRSDNSLIKKSSISDDDKPAASGLLLIVSVMIQRRQYFILINMRSYSSAVLSWLLRVQLLPLRPFLVCQKIFASPPQLYWIISLKMPVCSNVIHDSQSIEWRPWSQLLQVLLGLLPRPRSLLLKWLASLDLLSMC
jgi:hypothetical protein